MTMFLVRTAARTAVWTKSCRSFCVSHTQLSDRKVSLASGDSYIIIIIIITRDSFSFRSVRLRVLVQMLCRFMRENVAVCIFYHIKRCLCVYRVWCWECLRRRRRRMRALFTWQRRLQGLTSLSPESSLSCSNCESLLPADWEWTASFVCD